MKLTNSTEKSLAIVAMLLTQEDNKPLPSAIIVNRLQISESYTKKLLRKLVVANIITSSPGNTGGFCITRELHEISMLEIIEAIEGTITTYPDFGTIAHTFSEFPKQISEGETVMKEIFSNADKLWRDELQKQTLDKVFRSIFGDHKVIVNWMDL